MNEMPKNYDPKENEENIFKAWYEGGYFKRPAAVEGENPEPYSIVIPPPNVTGSLHMGHALNDTIQDLLIRRARMQGKRARWVLGTDHAGIATQNKVEQRIAKEGLTRFDLGREGFVDKCWEWREEFGSTIVEQLKRMGCSCDFDDEKFTMSKEYQAAVRKVFCDWYRKGLIYRGNRIINWCPRCTTSLSDLETEHEDEAGKLWYLRYPLKEPTEHFEYLTVATTRPETMLGDTAVAVSANDERYKELIGKVAILPLVGREIPVIADQHVDSAFGTGMVKITPAHDPNDFEVGQRHNLEAINVLNADATINELGGKYAGMDRYVAREAIVADLDALGLLEKIEDHDHSVGHCYRCHTTVEPWLSEQWFVSMKPLAEPAIEAVKQGRVKFTPERWSEVYFQWMENIRDWCISRQLWWGHRIPIFYCDDCGWMDASETDIEVCPVCGKHVRQDEDVLDTWFSSQLWPFATMGWLEDGDAAKELEECYPTAVLSTARDILFLWVARMIMSSMYFLDGEIPFHDVIIHPTVFNAQGKRMSKSLGTGVDPLELMENYGADGMRFGLMLQVTGAQDLKFSEEKLEYSRNFTTKIWNAARFIMMNLEDFECEGKVLPVVESIEDKWILSKLASLVEKVDDGLSRYDFGEVARELSAFFWNDFCDWYIELCKARLNAGGEGRKAAQSNLIFVLDNALRLLHPFMPFVTEEIWGYLPHGDSAEMLIVAAWPNAADFESYKNEEAVHAMSLAQAVISSVRSVRARYAISPKTELSVVVKAADDAAEILDAQRQLITSLGRISSFTISNDKPAHASTIVAEGLEIYVIVDGYVDFEAEAKRLGAERDKTAKELEKVSKKLSNPGFLAKAAPEIIEKDRAKEAALKETLASLDERLADLS